MLDIAYHIPLYTVFNIYAHVMISVSQ